MKAYEQITASGAQTRIQKKQVFTMAKNGREREALPLLEDFLREEPRDMYLHSSYAAACKRNITVDAVLVNDGVGIQETDASTSFMRNVP